LPTDSALCSTLSSAARSAFFAWYRRSDRTDGNIRALVLVDLQCHLLFCYVPPNTVRPSHPAPHAHIGIFAAMCTWYSDAKASTTICISAFNALHLRGIYTARILSTPCGLWRRPTSLPYSPTGAPSTPCPPSIFLPAVIRAPLPPTFCRLFFFRLQSALALLHHTRTAASTYTDYCSAAPSGKHATPAATRHF